MCIDRDIYIYIYIYIYIHTYIHTYTLYDITIIAEKAKTVNINSQSLCLSHVSASVM